jgi:Na+-translocating ferredoxin:NAD+ oxidoreductase subunit E
MVGEKKLNFLKTLIYNNPLFALCLGMCPALAVTTTLENSYIMGLSVLFVLMFSNLIISLISKHVAEEIRIPAYIMIIATFVTIVELLLSAYVPAIYRTLGIYIPLIVVNCIILGRALSYASSNNVYRSIVDAFKVGLGFTIAISILGIIREVLGTNTLTIMDKISPMTGYIIKYQVFPTNSAVPNNLFVTPGGAFIALGVLLGIVNAVRMRGEQK